MTSVGTQTHWSWLRDLQEISRLNRERGAKLSLGKSEIQSLQEEGCSPNLAHDQGPVRSPGGLARETKLV